MWLIASVFKAGALVLQCRRLEPYFIIEHQTPEGSNICRNENADIGALAHVFVAKCNEAKQKL